MYIAKYAPLPLGGWGRKTIGGCSLWEKMKKGIGLGGNLKEEYKGES
jgi:hypothetical protein